MTPVMRPGPDGLYHTTSVADRLREWNDPPTYLPDCWLAQHGRWEGGTMPSCEGRLIQAHLIPRQKLVRELGKKLGAEMVEDPRTWVLGCGGVTGGAGRPSWRVGFLEAAADSVV